MLDILTYSLLSVLVVSLISFIGAVTISIKNKRIENFLVYIIALSAGALLGDAFIHLLPEAMKNGFNVQISFFILSGIGFSFIVEKIVRWRHCHHLTTKQHPHPLSTMNIVGDSFHNFIDGIIIGASYLISIPLGIATTIAVIFHEIPQEIGDFGVLIYAGFSKRKALIINFIISLTSFVGLIVSILIGFKSQNLLYFLIPFAAGNFIYIATADLIPELHKETTLKKSLIQLLMFLLGIIIMYGLLILD